MFAKLVANGSNIKENVFDTVKKQGGRLIYYVIITFLMFISPITFILCFFFPIQFAIGVWTIHLGMGMIPFNWYYLLRRMFYKYNIGEYFSKCEDVHEDPEIMNKKEKVLIGHHPHGIMCQGFMVNRVFNKEYFKYNFIAFWMMFLFPFSLAVMKSFNVFIIDPIMNTRFGNTKNISSISNIAIFFIIINCSHLEIV